MNASHSVLIDLQFPMVENSARLLRVQYNLQIILMISLQDEISKFQKMVYNKQLAEFVTVDQMFVGGGITVESLVRENNFIIEELKKMGAVFRNYCKLNDKVYTKIMQHELGMHEEQSRINAIVSSVDRKLEDALKTIKKLHQEAVMQNQKSSDLVVDALEPIKQQLKTKVDQTTFTAKMKQILEQYDEGGLIQRKDQQLEGSEFNQERKNSGEMFGRNGQISSSPGQPRKKGKVGFDEFQKLKQQIQNRLTVNETKISHTSNQGSETKDLFMKYIPIINKSSSEIINHSGELYKMNAENTENFNNLHTSLNRFQVELNNRINQHIWTTKFEAYHQKNVKHLPSLIEEVKKMHQNDIKNVKQEIYDKITKTSREITKAKDQMSTIKLHSQENQILIAELKQIVEDNQHRIDQEHSVFVKTFDQIAAQAKRQVKQLDKNLRIEIASINKSIESLSHTIEQSVLKAVNKRVQAQLKVIENDIREIRGKIKQSNSDIIVVCEQIRNIKDVLSRKANFSDFIQFVEKKADKQDFKELQYKLHETSQQFVSKNLNESINISKFERVESIRKINSISKTSKTLLGQQSSPLSKPDKQEVDSGTKLFMCGFDGHIDNSNNRKFASQTSRRSRLKSSSAVASDFAL